MDRGLRRDHANNLLRRSLLADRQRQSFAVRLHDRSDSGPLCTDVRTFAEAEGQIVIYEALLTPSEVAPRINDIKRALLTYDRVLIPAPNDRDMIPPQAFSTALGLPPIFGMNMGPVRPLGKTESYDDDFDRILNACKQAVDQGIISVFSSYTQSSNFTIGAVLTGGYPLNPRAMMLIYRTMARNNEFLLKAIQDDPKLLDDKSNAYLPQLALPNCLADGSHNDDPAMPMIEGDLLNPENREMLTNVARGRLAAVMKSIGYCSAKNLIPLFSERFQNAITEQILANSHKFLDELVDSDPYWLNRSRALRIAHSEYIDETVLTQLSMDEVIRLRSKVWANQAKERDALMKSIADMSAEIRSMDDFETTCKEKIRRYRSQAEELERERAALVYKVKCDVGIGIGTLGTLAGAGAIAQIQTAIGAATALLAGCVFAITKLKEYGPAAKNLRAAEEEFKDTAGFGLHQFYQQLS
jgi:hypothetical protein